ncbi:SCF E3 ubiquitin ligase complex F-box protein grrA [Cytospora mali]|uniref:SCF E3 ubiquitin ligase complex F-box protein grrA n=1 Tax=Cytospora mali TaxID=578113 RepID=A0A194V047_CYTMA|nr:SCF E3 ubiquitin ligase complex F-box protein grrA [Valsa mali var. pyri (nom. inval.)]
MSSQQAPSLDTIARAQAAANTSATPPPTIEVEDNQDSRSTSSASSPLPPEYEESDFYHNGNDSQSSLGVPNLQDMQVTDEYECLPPVQRLPNEILICIFAKLSAPTDLRNVMLTCKRWSKNAVELLWHRPACTSWPKHSLICRTLTVDSPHYAYAQFIKRLNLASLADKVNDGSVQALAVCDRVERLTLTNCKGLTDGGLIPLVTNSSHLMALDISGDGDITEASIRVIAEHCKRLQGLNISNCTKISNESLVLLAENCRYLKRLKLNECSQLTDEAALAFAQHCPNILEIDLHQCKLVGNAPVTNLLVKGNALRELRLANCELVDDSAFLSLPTGRTFEHLRILDLTSCARVTDRAIERIIDAAPRLRNLVLAKCRNITDQAVFAISRLGKNLHYVHLGHCVNLTDEAVKRLVHCCNRIRYIDLGCCTHLTDESVTRLAVLPKLKRIGLVKCNNITDVSVYALAKANQRYRQRKDAEGREYNYSSGSSLERVHLSYCTQLTLKSIIKLLNSCPRLTHLSLTGVQAFLRTDLEQFCRDAPAEFTEHQRNVFCVFSGQGVSNLRRYLNTDTAFVHLRDTTPTGFPRHTQVAPNFGYQAGPPAGHSHPDVGFDEQERDVVEDDDGLDDGTDMVIDAAPLVGPPPNTGVHGTAGASLDASIIPPPPPVPSQPPSHWNPHLQYWHGTPSSLVQGIQPPNSFQHLGQVHQSLAPGFHGAELGDAMDTSPARPSASAAPLRQDGPQNAANTAHLRDNTTRGRSFSNPVQVDVSDNGGSSRSSPDAS